MNRKVGELVWVPAGAHLLWASKEEKLISRQKITALPQLAVIVDIFDDKTVTVFYDGDYWIIDKKHIYEVSDVYNDGRC